jgi:hypothetical protein
MREKVHTNDGVCDIGHDEPPRVSSTEVVVDLFLASRNEPAEVHAEVGTRVDQKLPSARSIRNEEEACRCRADICRL